MSHVEVFDLVSEDASVAKVEVYLDGHTFSTSAVGSAKKHPSDPPVHAVGEALALSRALREVAEELERYATETNANHIRAVAEEEKLDRIMRALYEKTE